MLNKNELGAFLIQKADEYNNPAFISSDPIQIPHRFDQREDIEIIAFLIATIAWGNRVSIIRSGENLLRIMGNSPFDFIMNYEGAKFTHFVHRTFNGTDLDFFFRSLKNLYQSGIGLEGAFETHPEMEGMKGRIIQFRQHFLAVEHQNRSTKHLSDPSKGSSAKRLNMYLRWMVRSDQKGVDFGLWKTIPSAELMIPLDVHTGNIARKLGLITRKQNDWQALEELMGHMRTIDANDPARFDFALFGLGAFEQF